MNRTELVVHVSRIASHLGVQTAPDWSGLDAVWPLLEKMKDEGAVVLLKLDGERTEDDDNGQYTALASGPPLQRAIRTDADSMEEAVSFVICHYAARFWGVPLPLAVPRRKSDDLH